MPKRAPVYPCTTFVPTSAGQFVPVRVEKRDRLPYDNGYERAVVRRVIGPSHTGAIRVMAEQETGEEMCVGEYGTTIEAKDAQRAHLRDHPEHRSCWLEPVTVD